MVFAFLSMPARVKNIEKSLASALTKGHPFACLDRRIVLPTHTSIVSSFYVPLLF